MTDCKKNKNCEPLFCYCENDEIICIGLNDASERKVENDIFAFCWETEHISERTFWDIRDLLILQAVINSGLVEFFKDGVTIQEDFK